MNRTRLGMIITVCVLFSGGAVLSASYHGIKVDGDLSSFCSDENIAGEAGDSKWSKGAIDALYVTWDQNNLYLGIQGFVDGCGWLLYMDVNPELSQGATDLTSIDNWQKGARFWDGGAIDFFFGSWDGAKGNFYQVLTPTASRDLTGSNGVQVATSFSYTSGGSEMKVPFDVLYGLGNGKVPVGAKIRVVAALCDESALGGDSAPLNKYLPNVDRTAEVIIDRDNDGVPDDTYAEISFSISEVSRTSTVFSPDGNGIGDTIEFGFYVSRPAELDAAIYDLNGYLVKQFETREISFPGAEQFHVSYVWDGLDDNNKTAPGGIYFFAIKGESDRIRRKNVPFALIR